MAKDNIIWHNLFRKHVKRFCKRLTERNFFSSVKKEDIPNIHQCLMVKNSAK